MLEREAEIARLEQVNLLGLTYLSTVIILNGGAMLAVLSVIGSSTSESPISFDLASLKCAMTAFLVGIGTIMIALLVSYIFTANNAASGLTAFLNTKIVLINSLLALVSLAALVCGILSLIVGVQING